MSIEKTVNDDAVVYTVTDANDELLNSLFDINTIERDVIIFDLVKTENISSKFISTLSNIQKEVNGKKKFIISGASQSVKNVLKSMSMDQYFKIV
jgi:anti-anti-sigma regulatory factor